MATKQGTGTVAHGHMAWRRAQGKAQAQHGTQSQAATAAAATTLLLLPVTVL